MSEDTAVGPETSSDPSPSAPDPAAKRGAMRFRRSSERPRLAPEDAKRQGEITTRAFRVLGREGAIAFLNTDHAGLGARPLDLAIASAAGSASVEAELERLGALADPARRD